jgi:putative addiction module component (TIGR02574 family)
MPSKVSNPPAGFDDLTVEEKLDYVESLWDRIAAKPKGVAVPDWHLEVIEQRTREGQAGSRDARSWDDFREELRNNLRQRRSTR